MSDNNINISAQDDALTRAAVIAHVLGYSGRGRGDVIMEIRAILLKYAELDAAKEAGVSLTPPAEDQEPMAEDQGSEEEDV